MMEKRYWRALSYGKREEDEKLERSDERTATIESSRQCVMPEAITALSYHMARGDVVGVDKSSMASFSSRLVDTLKSVPLKYFGTCSRCSCVRM